jgi:hypothetical protein
MQPLPVEVVDKPINKEGTMVQVKSGKWLLLSVLLLAGLCAAVVAASTLALPAVAAPPGMEQPTGGGAAGDHVVLAWNDLGMHCYNPDFQDIGVLPPWNTLWAQVVQVGDPPQIVTEGISVTFVFTDNTYSVGKSDFWDISPYQGVQNAQWLFDLASPLQPDMGLTGVGLSGPMEPHGDHFLAEGIPLTEYRDSDPATPYPYQLATVIAYDAGTGQELARTITVAPVSTEMHCDNCHYDYGPGNDDFGSGVVEQNILLEHDKENQEEYPAGFEGPLMDRRPVLCAWCHGSNALGAPEVPGIPNLSEAIHEKHAGRVPDSLAGCYNCHPGPETECLRGVMSSQYGMDCVDCHGGMEAVSQNPEPWLNEPRCDSPQCHGSAYEQDQALYRMSKEHGGIYCEACHDSTHAIAPSTEPNDAIKFIGWQGHAGTLDSCTVCHAALPAGGGPHGITGQAQRSFTFQPDRSSIQEPGGQAVYNHTLHNTGNVSDTYELTWTSSQGWAEVSAGGGSSLAAPSLTLLPGETAQVTVNVNVPDSDTVLGLTETTVVTATSTVSPTLTGRVMDTTRVLRLSIHLYLPLVTRER